MEWWYRLRCVRVRLTPLIYVSTCTVGSAQCSVCEVYGSSAMAAILLLLLIIM